MGGEEEVERLYLTTQSFDENRVSALLRRLSSEDTLDDGGSAEMRECR
jgi:hypothetical protein